MFKTVTISFRTRQELLEWLDHACRESRCSRSSLIETILRDFLAGRAEKGIHPENRSEIKGGAPPAANAKPPEGITYLTLGGVRIGLPKSLCWRIVFDEKRSIFQLDFTPGDGSATEVLSPPQRSEVVVWNSAKQASRSEDTGTMHDSSNEGLPLAGSRDAEAGKSPLEGSHPAPKKH